jgi:hypothetical protein
MARRKSPSSSEGDFYIGADGRDEEGGSATSSLDDFSLCGCGVSYVNMK